MHLKKLLLMSLCLFVSALTFALTPITGPDRVCLGTSVMLSNVTPGGSWSSGDATVTVGPGGSVTGMVPGTATISYTVGTDVATFSFTVTALPSPISGPSLICNWTTATLSNSVPGGTWSSSNPAVASIGSASGLLVGTSIGTTLISYIPAAGCMVTKTMTVDYGPYPITGNPNICLGSSSTLSSIGDGTWSSSNSAITTIDPTTGVATGISTGVANITYSLTSGCLSTVMVTVSTAPPAISGSAGVCAGSALTLSNPMTGGTWSSSDLSTATVGTSSGIVSGVAGGTATISYSVPGCSYATKIVTIAPMPVLSSPLVAPDICDVTLFTYEPSSVTTGTIFTWSRGIFPGITALAAMGTGTIGELLHNVTTLPIPVTYVYTLTASGCSNVQSVTVTVKPTPVLTSTSTPAPACDSALFYYSPTSSVPGTTFTWSRGFYPGIEPAWASGGVGPISEILDNTTSLPHSVTYDYILTAGGCSSLQYVTVIVNPATVLTSPTTLSPICDSTLFVYAPISTTPGVLFNWSRAYIAGINNPGSSGAGIIAETLDNTVAVPVSVTYVYTLTAGGCTNTKIVTVAVKPTPTLTSTLTPPTICDTVTFNYSPTSATAGTTFTWSRPAVAGISNPAATGAGNPAELLTNTTAGPLAVTYQYTLLANGCSNEQDVAVMVTPCSPAPTIIERIEPGTELNIHPNPVQNELHIHAADKISQVIIIDALGRTVFSNQCDASNVVIDLSGLPDGSYLLKINNAGVRRFIKR